jgi:hypothetical protein
MMSLAIFLSCMVAGHQDPAAKPHPFLFVTQAEASRAREAVKADEALAGVMKKILDAAREGKVAGLPPLERAWWTEARNKPWEAIYPEINHHTGKVPREWAALAMDCAYAHLLSPGSGLSVKGKEVLLGLSDYTFEFEHYDVGMNYTTWGVTILEAYDILYDVFSEAERSRMDAFFKRMLDAVVANDEYWIAHEVGGPLNNHYLWHKLCRLMYGLFYGEPALVDEALYGKKGVLDCLRYGFTDDGLWLEASLNYQFAATAPMVLIAELLENAGADFSLWDFQTDDSRTLRQAYDALFDTLFPDRTLPNIGDCYGRRGHLGASPDYGILFARFKDPRYAWILNDYGKAGLDALFYGVSPLPEGTAPPMYSTLWPEHNYAMLRSIEGDHYWTGEGWSLFASFSNAPVHQHADKLSIMLFGNGRHWLIDCEARASVYHAFSSAVQRELNRQTHCHNTVLVDNRSQRFPDGRLELLEYHALPEVKRLTMGDLHGRLYEGVRQMRTLVVTSDYVLDLYQVASRETHDYAWLAHVNGASAGVSADGWQTIALPDAVPWNWLRDAEAVSNQARYWEVFADGQDRFAMDVATDAPVEAVRCGFPRDDSENPETWPMRMLRCTRPSAWFAALYRLGQDTSPAAIEVVPAELGRYAVTVQFGSTARTHLIPAVPLQNTGS